MHTYTQNITSAQEFYLLSSSLHHPTVRGLTCLLAVVLSCLLGYTTISPPLTEVSSREGRISYITKTTLGNVKALSRNQKCDPNPSGKYRPE